MGASAQSGSERPESAAPGRTREKAPRARQHVETDVTVLKSTFKSGCYSAEAWTSRRLWPPVNDDVLEFPPDVYLKVTAFAFLTNDTSQGEASGGEETVPWRRAHVGWTLDFTGGSRTRLCPPCSFSPL